MKYYSQSASSYIEHHSSIIREIFYLYKDPQNYDLLLRGNGLRCMTKNTITNYGDCGTSGVETW